MVQDSRSASYPGAAIASSYDFGSIDFGLLWASGRPRNDGEIAPPGPFPLSEHRLGRPGNGEWARPRRFPIRPESPGGEIGKSAPVCSSLLS
jgi:hypothetical protein